MVSLATMVEWLDNRFNRAITTQSCAYDLVFCRNITRYVYIVLGWVHSESRASLPLVPPPVLASIGMADLKLIFVIKSYLRQHTHRSGFL